MKKIRGVRLMTCVRCGRSMPMVLMHFRASDHRAVCDNAQSCTEWRDKHPDHTNGQTISPPYRRSRLIPPVESGATNERHFRR